MSDDNKGGCCKDFEECACPCATDDAPEGKCGPTAGDDCCGPEASCCTPQP